MELLQLIISLISFFTFGYLAFYWKVSIKNEDVHKFLYVLTIISLIYFFAMAFLVLYNEFKTI